jgi:hypothetical protein
LSEWNAYIVPVDDRPCRRKGDALIAHFQSTGLIDGFDDEELGWYAGGEGPGYLGVHFEYLEVYDSDAAHFIPSGTTGGYGARCPACRAELDEALYRLRDGWPESHEKKDMAGIKVRCRSCGARTLLKDLPFEIETAMTHFFVMLANARPEEWDATFLQDVEWIVGCKCRVVMERM